MWRLIPIVMINSSYFGSVQVKYDEWLSADCVMVGEVRLGMRVIASRVSG